MSRYRCHLCRPPRWVKAPDPAAAWAEHYRTEHT